MSTADIKPGDEPVTPAQELRAAAAKLRETAANATDGPWELDGPYWWHSGDCTHVITDRRNRWTVAVMPRREDAGDRRDADAAWIALANPELAEPLAAAMDAIAFCADMDPDLLHRVGYEHVLAAVRVINGSTS